MVKKLYIITFFLLIGFLPLYNGFMHSTIAQEVENRFSFKNQRKKSISINFELINNLIVIPVIINDSDTLHFILDSGFNSVMISELGLNESVSLNQTRKVQLVGLGEGEPIQAIYSTGNDLHISGIVGKSQDVYILVEDIFFLSSKMGQNINGILGHSFFRDFIVEINYTNKRLTFHDPARYRYRKRRNADELALTIKQNKSYVQTTITQQDNSVVSALLVIDTGGSHALWLDSHANDLITLPEKNYSTLIGTGLNGPIYGKIGRLNKFSLGNFSLSNVIASFPDSISIAYAIGVDGRLGSLGSEILKRFNLIFDYQAGKLTIWPNKKFNQAFFYNPSGIEISNPLPGLPYFVVTHVRAGSNAYNAGIRLEDELFSIQGESLNKMTLNDVQLILHGKPGKTIRIKVKRKGEIIPVEFKLEQVI